ncbi:hypothetical protein, partial [Halalkalicoccus sp. NIPERK01]|uniref:hypothetical protein n=1 Tax=Halalkalicoccus sp. NIPERK01 TaxID=3053469 RepID=UPI00256F335D
GEPHLVSRQGALAAARAVFESGDWSTEDLPTPSITVAILLVHAVSSELSELRRNTGRFIGDIPADLMMEIVRAGLFNEADNSTSVMDRT